MDYLEKKERRYKKSKRNRDNIAFVIAAVEVFAQIWLIYILSTVAMRNGIF